MIRSQQGKTGVALPIPVNATLRSTLAAENTNLLILW
jgi:hypothetical protein